MSQSEFDRDDPEVARSVMTELCPNVEDRRRVLAQLLRSIATAEKHAPNSWAVTLFEHGFRLNVGQVEAFTFFGE